MELCEGQSAGSASSCGGPELHKKGLLNVSIHEGQLWTGLSHCKGYFTVMMDSVKEHPHYWENTISFLTYLSVATHITDASTGRIPPLTGVQWTTEPHLQDSTSGSPLIWKPEILKALKTDTFTYRKFYTWLHGAIGSPKVKFHIQLFQCKSTYEII